MQVLDRGDHFIVLSADPERPCATWWDAELLVREYVHDAVLMKIESVTRADAGETVAFRYWYELEETDGHR